MRDGTEMVKLRQGKLGLREEYKRLYILDFEGQRIRWEPSSKSVDKSRSIGKTNKNLLVRVHTICFGAVPIRNITEVREGHQSDVFRSFQGVYGADQCLSIVYGANHDQLNLVAPTELKASQWIIGLRHVIKNASSESEKRRRREIQTNLNFRKYKG